MAWTSLREKLSDLPIIICGPIVRRVTIDSVSIWIALNTYNFNENEEVSIQLDIYEDTKKEVWVTTDYTKTKDIIKIGEFISIALVTAKSNLESGKIYYYNITIISDEILSLDDSKVINKDKICFEEKNETEEEDDRLPSFVVPPKEIEKLRVLHSSCRKPHGKGIDALAEMAKVLENKTANPLLRPQILCLTGDQIYADDVADVLLFMIDDARKNIFVYDELIDGVKTMVDDLRPGYRSEVITTAGLLIDEPETGKSHLMKFSEYALMYLFSWSDELWPSLEEELPIFSQVFPEVNEKIKIYRIDNDSNKSGKGENTSIYDGLINSSVPTEIREEHKKNISEEEFKSTKKKQFDEEIYDLTTFRESLVLVRKLLANISVYMIFDDHDITDDWNLNANWCERVLKEPTSRNIMLNGLVAYSIFQHWGNVGDSFDLSKFPASGNILDFFHIRELEGTDEVGYVSIKEDKFESIQIPNFIDKTLTYPNDNRFDWHFNISFEKYTLAVIDTRTMRGYPKQFSFENGRFFPSLISKEGLIKQFSWIHFDSESATSKPVVLVSPAPIIGLIGFENYPYKTLVNSEKTVSKALGYITQMFLQRIFKTAWKEISSSYQELSKYRDEIAEILEILIDNFIHFPELSESEIEEFKNKLEELIQERGIPIDKIPFLRRIYELDDFEDVKKWLIRIIQELPSIEDIPVKFLQNFNFGDKFREKYEAEAWGLCEEGLFNLLEFLSENFQNGKFIVLSGDVHYSYTARQQFWSETNNSLVIAQCVSSSSKNEGDLGNILENLDVPFFNILNFGAMQTVGWNTIDGEEVPIGYLSSYNSTDTWNVKSEIYGRALHKKNDFYWDQTKKTAQIVIELVIAIITENPILAGSALLDTQELEKKINLVDFPPLWQFRTDLIKNFSLQGIEAYEQYIDYLNDVMKIEPPNETLILGLDSEVIKDISLIIINPYFLISDVISSDIPSYIKNYHGICGSINFGLVDFFLDNNKDLKEVTHQVYSPNATLKDNNSKTWKSYLQIVEMGENPSSEGQSLYPKLS